VNSFPGFLKITTTKSGFLEEKIQRNNGWKKYILYINVKLSHTFQRAEAHAQIQKKTHRRRRKKKTGV